MAKIIIIWISLMCCIMAERIEGYAYHVNNEIRIFNEIHEEYPLLSHGFFNDTISTHGWAVLSLHTVPNESEELQSYSVGYLEAYLTEKQIYNFALNCFHDTPSPELVEFLKKNDEFINGNIINNPDDIYWHHISLIVQQGKGMIDGYKKFGKQPLDEWNLRSMQLSGDYPDIQNAISKSSSTGDHCSGFIRIAGDNDDIYIGHNTWTSYNSMTRIWKIYDFPFMNSASNIMSFCSYPGYLFSGDDYYTLSSGLVVQETTIGNRNDSLLVNITPSTLYIYIRNMVANRLAHNGEEWCRYFSLYNNGAYNNQFMIIDMNKYTPHQELRDGLFYLLEQLPGYVFSKDITYELREKKYFGSYNLPFFKETFDLINIQPLIDQYGDHYIYNNTARAKIFRREASNINDLGALRRLMRYNDFKNDPYSKCDCDPPYSAGLAIAMRGDLNPVNMTSKIPGLGHRPHVATDGKITSYKLMKNGQNNDEYNRMISHIIVGPTSDQQEPFDWTMSDFNNTPHFGQPDVFNFSWYQLSSDTGELIPIE